jgi:glucans biosynthesis protein C
VSTPPSSRRADIDWIRVAAFGLLIIYHVGLVYAPWDWHVHSPHTIEALRYAALAMNPWRLTLLFFVSGVALRFMSRNRRPFAAIGQRLTRLVPPFLFGVLVLVPPQSWLEAMDKGSWSQGLGAWWLAEFSPAGFADGIPLNHLWFVLYIAVYSVLALGFSAWTHGVAGLERVLSKALSGRFLLILPMIYLAISRQYLFATYGLSNHLEVDWYNHASSFAVFTLGFVLALQDEFWRTFERLRWGFLGIALASLTLLIALEAHPGGMAFNGLVKNTMFAVDQWSTLGAVVGFASRHLRHADGPLLRYLTDAVFPCYLAHQTLLVFAVYLLEPQGLPLALEVPLLATITLGGSLLVYELVKRIGPVRPLWGLRRQAGT